MLDSVSTENIYLSPQPIPLSFVSIEKYNYRLKFYISQKSNPNNFPPKVFR